MLTTKPARSLARTTVLPTRSAKACARSTTSGEVCTVVTNSTRAITGTGLKKCMPMTLWGRSVAAARRVIGIDEVFEAMIASVSATTRSRSAKIFFLSSSFSVAASITSWRSACSSRSVDTVMRSRISPLASSSSFPRSTALLKERSIRPRAASAVSESIS